MIATLDNPQGTSFTAVLGVVNSAFLGYDLRTSLGSVSGPGLASGGDPNAIHHTTLGILNFTADPASATFTAIAGTVLYFPQFVDGSQTSQAGSAEWGTAIIITNTAGPGTPVASGTVTLTRDDGTPMNITLQDALGGPAGNTFQLGGGQTKLFTSPNLGGFTPSLLMSGLLR
jgi:hypothetical protein